jgi:hypothetical protein
MVGPSLLFSLLVGCSLTAAACDQIPAGQSFRIRLASPVASYSAKRGMPVQAILIQSPECDGAPVLPIGTLVEGKIKSAHRVGMGFFHETASVEIIFDRITPPGMAPVALQANVIEVDNAREKVKKNVIHGVRGSDTFPNHLTTRLLQLPSWDPDGLLILAARRAVFPVFPEPEIYFPRGTDLRMSLAAPLQFDGDIPPATAAAEFADAEKADIDDTLLSTPARAFTPSGRDGDIVNLAFLGSRERVANAFQAAGWVGSDSVSTRSVLHGIYDVLSLKSDVHMPISKQLLEDKASDFSLEKSFDSYAKRDHLRIWSQPEPWLGENAWLSGGVREVSAGLSRQRRQLRFVHRLESNLDREREKVVRDLTLAGCVDSVYEAARPDAPRFAKSPTGDSVRTDGVIAVIRLKDCEHPLLESIPASEIPAYRPKTRIARYLRTQILGFRSDVWRSNAVYTAFDLTRATIRAAHSMQLPSGEIQALRNQ